MDCSQKKMILVKVGRMGERVKEMCLLEGTYLDTALNTAGYSLNKDEEIVFNGTPRTSGALTFALQDKDIILIQRKKTIKVKVARVKEPLVEISINSDSTVEYSLIQAGRLPLPSEEIWRHIAGWPAGEKASLEDKVIENSIYVIEPRKNLRSKILTIISNLCEDENGEVDEATSNICTMLKRDYNIE